MGPPHPVDEVRKHLLQAVRPPIRSPVADIFTPCDFHLGNKNMFAPRCPPFFGYATGRRRLTIDGDGSVTANYVVPVANGLNLCI